MRDKDVEVPQLEPMTYTFTGRTERISEYVCGCVDLNHTQDSPLCVCVSDLCVWLQSALLVVSLSTPSDVSQFIVMESELDGTELHAEENTEATDPPRTHRVLTVFSLLALCFFAICGGPVGSEPVVTCKRT